MQIEDDCPHRLSRALQTTDANSILTIHTYDQRKRLTVSIGGQLTSYDFWPNGLLKKETLPDQITCVLYEYDDAQRLRKVSNNTGHSIGYTLDNLGNRSLEEAKDGQMFLRRQLRLGAALIRWGE